MHKDILLLGYAREGSTRVKNKMTRPFDDTTLFDIYMKKFEDIQQNNVQMFHPFNNIKMAISRSDKVLWGMIKKYDVDVLERSKYSVNASISNDCKKVYHYLENIDEDYVMWINGCFPLLTIGTILNIGRLFLKRDNIKGVHCVKKVKNWIWDYNNKSIINGENIGRISTVHFKPYLESVHCCHIYNKNYLLEQNSYWPFTENNPYLYEVEDSIEFMDIDTDVEFKVLEELWKNR